MTPLQANQAVTQQAITHQAITQQAITQQAITHNAVTHPVVILAQPESPHFAVAVARSRQLPVSRRHPERSEGPPQFAFAMTHPLGAHPCA